MRELDWDEIITKVYDYVFEVNEKQFNQYKKTNFQGTYMVTTKNGTKVKQKI